jgi:hypothetical protein
MKNRYHLLIETAQSNPKQVTQHPITNYRSRGGSMKAPILRILSITVCQFLSAFIWVAALLAADMNPGIPVGSKIPAFEAKDQKGMVQTFESIRGPKGAFLVFYRSADW